MQVILGLTVVAAQQAALPYIKKLISPLKPRVDLTCGLTCEEEATVGEQLMDQANEAFKTQPSGEGAIAIALVIKAGRAKSIELSQTLATWSAHWCFDAGTCLLALSLILLLA